ARLLSGSLPGLRRLGRRSPSGAGARSRFCGICPGELMEGRRWVVEVNKALLGKNIELAQRNRQRFHAHKIVVVNILSAPGSGKTSLLERTLSELRDRLRIGVQVGDLQTDNDARRLMGRGAPVVQIVTGGCCHLDASMIAQANEKFDLDQF